jgi:uncharacterized membrane protein YeaQ/YmgE (transglycosylase-associated protein family)
MTMLAILGWIFVGAVVGGLLAGFWKLRGLTLAWGVAVGGVGGVVGGLISRVSFPAGTFSDIVSLIIAVIGAIAAMVIARGRVTKEQTHTV